MLPKDSIVMHPFPRVTEIPKSFDQDKEAKYFDQIKFGVWCRQISPKRFYYNENAYCKWKGFDPSQKLNKKINIELNNNKIVNFFQIQKKQNIIIKLLR